MTGDSERFEEFGLFDDVPAPDQWEAIVHRAERAEVTPIPGRRRAPWLLVAAAVVLALTGAFVLAGRGSDDGDIASVTAPGTAPTMPPAETLPPPGAIACRDATSLAEIAALMPYDGGIPVDYRVAPDLATLVGRSRVVAIATIDSMAVDGRFTVLELSDVHVLTGVLSTTLAQVAAPGRWTQERERVRFDGLRAVLFVHAAELVPGAEWIPDVQGIVIGCDGVDGTAAILEPLPPDADLSSVDALAEDALAVNHPGS